MSQSNQELPSVDELEKAYQDIRRIHSDHLIQHGVKLPEKSSYKWIWLAMLHHFSPDYVHKDAISNAVRRTFPDAAADQQVRHLKRDGWNIVGSRGLHRLDDPFQPSPEYVNERSRRQGRLSADDFDDIKRTFANRCATCGARESEPDPRYGRDKVVLQQGHQDPDKPSDSQNNIIPQCQFCNRAYKRDFTFDSKGRVRAVADVGPVTRARKQVRRKIWELLQHEFRG